MDRRLDDLSRAIEGLRTEMSSRFNNVYVLIGATWLTTIGAIIGLYFRRGLRVVRT